MFKMKRKPVVGETLWMVVHGYGQKAKEPRQVNVISVGKKYFKVVYPGSVVGMEFCLDGWVEKTEYTPDSFLYESLQEIEDEKEWDRLANELRQFFQHNVKLSLKGLRLIKAIVDDETKKPA